MLKIVVVDDEVIQRRGLVLTTSWEQFGCEVVGEAENAESALNIIRTVKPDIVVTDIKMPKKSGLELIQTLRDTLDCEFIIMSGYSEFSYAKQALEMGVHRYLLKPIDDEELAEAIESTAEYIKQKRNIQKLRMESLANSQNSKASISFYENFGDGKPPNAYLEKALLYIMNHCDRNLTVREVAASMHISPSYLWKVFSEQTALTFNEYLTTCRIKKAIHLLRDEHMKIYEIAQSCGYKDTRYFSNVFRKVVGVNPSEYRGGCTQDCDADGRWDPTKNDVRRNENEAV